MGTKNQNGIIKIKTVELGELEIIKDTVIKFKKGLVGFENLKRFALIEVEECEPFLWCVSLDEPEFSLPILEYNRILPKYEIKLSDKEKIDLEISDDDNINLFFVITVDQAKESVTANLKGPIVINPGKKLGVQIVVSNEKYVVNYPIV